MNSNHEELCETKLEEQEPISLETYFKVFSGGFQPLCPAGCERIDNITLVLPYDHEEEMAKETKRKNQILEAIVYDDVELLKSVFKPEDATQWSPQVEKGKTYFLDPLSCAFYQAALDCINYMIFEMGARINENSIYYAIMFYVDTGFLDFGTNENRLSESKNYQQVLEMIRIIFQQRQSWKINSLFKGVFELKELKRKILNWEEMEEEAKKGDFEWDLKEYEDGDAIVPAINYNISEIDLLFSTITDITMNVSITYFELKLFNEKKIFKIE